MMPLNFEKLTEWERENFRLVRKGRSLKLFRMNIDHFTGLFTYEDCTKDFIPHSMPARTIRKKFPFKEIAYRSTIHICSVNALLREIRRETGDNVKIVKAPTERLHVLLATKICRKFNIGLRIVENMSRYAGYASVNGILIADYATKNPYYFCEVFLHELVHARLVDRIPFLWRKLPEYNKWLADTWYRQGFKNECDTSNEIAPLQISLAHRLYDQLASSEYAILSFLEDLLKCSNHHALDIALIDLIYSCAGRIQPMPIKKSDDSRVLDRYM